MEPINFYELEKESARFRVTNGIGLNTVYGEDGKFTHTEETEEYRAACRVLHHENHIKEPLYPRD